jgi:hypothetical protein
MEGMQMNSLNNASSKQPAHKAVAAFMKKHKVPLWLLVLIAVAVAILLLVISPAASG